MYKENKNKKKKDMKLIENKGNTFNNED